MKKYLLPILLIGFWGCEEQDTSPPEVNILIPDDVVFEIADIAVEADDNEEISRLEFYIDGEIVHTETGPPSYQNVYVYKWNTVQYENGSDHIVRVDAYDNSDNQGSDEAIFTVDNSDAGPGEWGPTSVAYNLTEMTITWEEYPEDNFKDYNVLYSQDEEGEKSTLSTYTDRSTTSHAITEFDPTVENWFWVQVTDTLGLSSIGWGMRNELDSEPAPVNVTDVTYDLESMTITWEEYSPNMGRIAGMNLSTGSTVGDDFASYELLQSDSENGTYTSVTVITDQSTTSHSITEFDPTQENWFKVKVTDFWNLTSTGDASTNEIDNPPAEVGITSITYDTTPQMIIAWEQSDDNDFASYELLQAVGWDEPDDNTYTSVAVISEQETTSYTVTEFDPNYVNWFKIKTTDHWGLTSIGNADNHEYNRSPEPVAITSVTYDYDLMTITWDQSDAEDFASYALMWSDNSEGEYDTVAVIDDISVTSFQINDFDPTVENWFRIIISDYWGKTNTCCEMTNDIQPPPSAPELHISLTGNDSLFIYWINSDSGSFSYRLFESQTENDINNNFTNTWDLSDTSITILSPSVGVWYYMVVVEDHWGLVSESNIFPITFCNEGEAVLWGECYSIENTTNLDLTNNNLTGSIPPEISDLTNLTELRLGSNQLTGSIPPEIGNLTNLTLLYSDDNQLTGPIPPEIGNLTNLTHLDLSDNQLTGSIPPEIGNLTNLTTLYLYDNQLTGDIPSEIGNLTNLTHLWLRNNQLTGEIPESICDFDIDWSNTYVFNISNNQLCPPYPSCIEDYDVGYQDISDCTLPPGYVELWGSFYSIENTTFIDLRDSGLTGEIPPEIGELINLTYLNLEFNDLEGSIPIEIWNLTNLHSLLLGDNQLTGSIPPEVGNLTNLNNYLNLHTNQLSGEIPPEIGNLQNLVHLYLFNNQLSGEVPSALGDLVNVGDFKLFNNILSGQIPENLCNLTANNSDYFHENNLCPPYPNCLLAEEFEDSNGNGEWDEGEPFTDADDDGVYDYDRIGDQDTTNCD